MTCVRDNDERVACISVGITVSLHLWNILRLLAVVIRLHDALIKDHIMVKDSTLLSSKSTSSAFSTIYLCACV